MQPMHHYTQLDLLELNLYNKPLKEAALEFCIHIGLQNVQFSWPGNNCRIPDVVMTHALDTAVCSGVLVISYCSHASRVL